jgi:hypothetical protein
LTLNQGSTRRAPRWTLLDEQCACVGEIEEAAPDEFRVRRVATAPPSWPDLPGSYKSLDHATSALVGEYVALHVAAEPRPRHKCVVVTTVVNGRPLS